MKLVDKARAGLGIAACRLPGVRRPLFVGWAVTNRCNLRCAYCNRPQRDQRELPIRSIIAILREMPGCGTQRVSFTGGEPLVREDLGEIVEQACRAGLHVSVSTNGLLLEEKLPVLRRVDEITVSLDDLAGGASLLRKGLDLEKVTAGIRAARAMGITVTLHTVLTKHNLNVEDMIAFARRLDVRVRFTPVEMRPGSEKLAKKFMPDVPGFRKAITRLIERKRAGESRIYNSTVGLSYFLHWPSDNDLMCCAGKIYCRLEPDGSLYTCGNLVGMPTRINAAEMGFRTAFEKLAPARCYACWCDTRVEMNLAYRLTPGVLWEHMTRR